MLRMAFKGLAARKFRLFATSLAVTLGVAFMAGTLVLTDTIQKTFDDLFSDIYDNTDAVVRAQGAFDSAGVEQRVGLGEHPRVVLREDRPRLVRTRHGTTIGSPSRHA